MCFEVFLVCDTDLECLAVSHSHGLIWYFISFYFIFFSWGMIIASPILSVIYLDSTLSVFVLAPFIISPSLLMHSQIQCRQMVRCVLYVCIASCCLFIWRIAHLDGLFTLCVSVTSCMCFFCVFSCGLAPPFASLHILSYLCCSLSLLFLLFFCMMCIWLGGLPTLFDWSLAASDACCLASFAHLWWCDALLTGCV